MRIQDVPQRGKKGNTVASRNRFGRYVKELKRPKHPATASQQRVWGNMTELSWLWNEISDERREGWRRLGLHVRTRAVFGQSGPLDGILVFKKLNTVLRICGRELLLDAPELPRFGPNPVIGFAAPEGRGGVTLKLKLRPGLIWEDRPPLEDLMLYAWAPCNAGVDKNSLYAFLGLPPAPTNGEIDFTKLYLAKLKEWRRLKPERYHIPLDGSRIFVRVWQQVNGWENELGMFRANALTPARKWPHWASKKGEK